MCEQAEAPFKKHFPIATGPQYLIRRKTWNQVRYAFAHFVKYIPFFPFYKQLLQKISSFSATETCELSKTPNALPIVPNGTYITFTGTQ
jgi:hypothetical protein